MGFLSSLKRLFFTTESVAKSAVENAVDYSKEKADKIAVNAKEKVHEYVDKTAGLREAVIEKANMAMENVEAVAENVWDKTKDVAADVAINLGTAVDKAGDLVESAFEKTKDVADDTGEFVQSNYVKTSETTSDWIEKAKETVGDVADKTKETAAEVANKLSQSEVVRKAGDLAEQVGSKVLETGSVALKNIEELSENVGSKVLETSDKTWDKIDEAKNAMVEKAKEVADNLGKKFDETVEKAEKFMEEEDAKPKKDFADETLTTGGSLLEGQDDFFSKAAQYADGNFDVFSEGKITIVPGTEPTAKAPAKTAGQDDHDGDGNEQIDDAIIVES